jgi:hypothetical protein
MIIVPLMQICWTLFSIVSGMIYFQEYETFSPSRSSHGTLSAIMFTIGVLVGKMAEECTSRTLLNSTQLERVMHITH